MMGMYGGYSWRNAILFFLLVVVTAPVSLSSETPVVVRSPGADLRETYAAREVARYFYQRTGVLPELVKAQNAPEGRAAVVVGRPERAPVRGLAKRLDARDAADGLGPQEYLLRTRAADGARRVLVTGGAEGGLLYGVYRLAEHMGVRFYIHGDVIPDGQMPLRLPEVHEHGAPLFKLRGMLPFHDFPEGPDWWNEDAYRAIISQLPKMGMNFIGFHCYPPGAGPEPLVWHGLQEDIGEGHRVNFAYQSHWSNTLREGWGLTPEKTSDYSFGASQLFPRDAYGGAAMKGMCPRPENPEEYRELFRRAGALLEGAFTYAQRLGVKTCVGTETPLHIPERLEKHVGEEAEAEDIYRGTFRRIMQSYPVDYYWLWTPEEWTWSGTSEKQVEATLADLRAAVDAAEAVDVPFTLATCGWVLGPQWDRAYFDDKLPKRMPMSCINRNVGHSPVEPGFADVEGRPTWAIPWLEDDPALTAPQLWAGRMRKDAVDARRYGCTGLMGIHWRTRPLGPNVAALARAAWRQGGWADAEPEGESEGPVGGNHARFSQDIADTEDDTLYRSVRYNVSAYHLQVPHGTYEVTLKFCEPHYREAGKRVFGVSVEGERFIDRLDIYEEAGPDRALDYTFSDIRVEDGWLDIEFHKIVEFSSIAAIVARGSETVKINCGGEKYGDYRADWPEGYRSREERYLPCGDFYRDWARVQFGEGAADAIAEVFTEVDGELPQPATWVNGPGGMQPNGTPWSKVAPEYEFVEDLADLRGEVEGEGNLARFDYWLETFLYMRSMARVRCTWARLNAALQRAKKAENEESTRRIARQEALPIRRELVDDVEETFRHLLAHVSTPGGLGTVTNWEQHILPQVLDATGERLKQYLGTELPDDALPSDEYAGPERLIVPVRQTSVQEGEALEVKVIVLSREGVDDVALHWRPLDGEDYRTVPAGHVARGVYRVTVPAQAARPVGFEYYVDAHLSGGKELVHPASAPELNRSVVVTPVR